MKFKWAALWGPWQYQVNNVSGRWFYIFSFKNPHFSRVFFSAQMKNTFWLWSPLILCGEMTCWIIQLFAFSQLDRHDIATDVPVIETEGVIFVRSRQLKWPSREVGVFFNADFVVAVMEWGKWWNGKKKSNSGKKNDFSLWKVTNLNEKDRNHLYVSPRVCVCFYGGSGFPHCPQTCGIGELNKLSWS